MTTRLADVIVPEVFNPYVIQRTAELSALVQSGIVVPNPELDKLASSGGKLINMPYWNDLTGDDEVLSDNGALTPAKITAEQDVAVLLMRGKAWAANDLTKALSGDDPMAAIGDLVAAYWARMEQKTLIGILTGAMGAATMTGNVHDISAVEGEGANITGTAFIDAKTKLGDAADRLTAVIMHSAVFASLEKQNLIEYIPNSEGVVDFPSYMGKRVIVDDGCPAAAGVYTTYLFGEGAIGRGEGGAPVPTETDRDSLAGDDILINRRHFILHPRGIAFTGSAAVTGASPTNVELATTTNWTRKYENKNIRIVQFKHKIAA
jgi:hypothetical protein